MSNNPYIHLSPENDPSQENLFNFLNPNLLTRIFSDTLEPNSTSSLLSLTYKNPSLFNLFLKTINNDNITLNNITLNRIFNSDNLKSFPLSPSIVKSIYQYVPISHFINHPNLSKSLLSLYIELNLKHFYNTSLNTLLETNNKLNNNINIFTNSLNPIHYNSYHIFNSIKSICSPYIFLSILILNIRDNTINFPIEFRFPKINANNPISFNITSFMINYLNNYSINISSTQSFINLRESISFDSLANRISQCILSPYYLSKYDNLNNFLDWNILPHSVYNLWIKYPTTFPKTRQLSKKMSTKLNLMNI